MSDDSVITGSLADTQDRPFTRRVHYIGGFYPGGPDFYRAMLQREAARHSRVRGIAVEVADEGAQDEGPIQRFRLTAQRPEGVVETRYALLRWEDIVLARLAWPWTWRVAAGAATLADYLRNGAILRMLRLSRRFGLIWIFPFWFYPLAVILASLAGFGAYMSVRPVGFEAVAFVLGLAVAAGLLAAACKLGQRSYAYLFLNNWIFSREIALDRAPDLWERLDAFARHVAEDIGEADEVAVIGHSFGASLAPIIAAKAAALAGSGRGRLTVLTLGASPAVIGLHPRASRFRDGLRQAASEPSITWIDVSSSYDFINFRRFDPVSGLRLEGGRTPTLLDTRLARRTGGGFLRKLALMRLHMQFIKSAESAEGYDYIALVTGAAPIAEMLAAPSPRKRGEGDPADEGAAA